MPRKKTLETASNMTKNPVKKAPKKTVVSKETEIVENKLASIDFSQKIVNFFKNNKLLYLSGLIIVLGVLGYYLYKFSIIAWVDQTPITRFQVYKELENKYGKDLKESVASDEIEKQIKEIETQQGGPEQLKQILEIQGMNMEDLKKQIEFQVMIEKMFGQDVQISDEEIKNYIKANKEQFADVIDPEASISAETKDQVSSLLKRQKTAKSFNDWLKDTLQSSRVIRQ
ncbi:MAG: Foldase protein PrsA [Candidatus Daviesbacteria bacterium GW2011_GWA1_38_7]|nr:MAG: Foldase protein PrsA [Candidatus Daviesbacteria bacterium GW2011_GWA1_38_7]